LLTLCFCYLCYETVYFCDCNS